MTQVWISAAVLSLATIIGSLPGFIIKALPHKKRRSLIDDNLST